MNKSVWIVFAWAGLSAATASARFVSPAEAQLRRAATDTNMVGAMIKDASVAQAADVIRDVIVQILSRDLPPVARDERIAAVVNQAFRAMPGQETSLASALGAALAVSPSASKIASVVSLIQRTAVTASKSAGVSGSGTAFANAYMIAMQTVAGAPGGGTAVPPIPAPPPVAVPYEGQRLP